MRDEKQLRSARAHDLADRMPTQDQGVGMQGKVSGTEGLLPGKSGQGLPWSLRSLFEKSLGQDLGGVRLHTDADAAALADSHDARAFATGQDIAFNAGEYQPDTQEGRRLIAHEVAHTVQQRGGAEISVQPSTTKPGDAAETNANTAADAMMAGQPTQVEAMPIQIARKTKGEGDEKKPLPTDISKIVTVSNANMKKEGSVTTKVNKDTVSIDSPRFTMAAPVELTPAALQADEDVGKVEVGPIQNVTSKRIGIYRKPGTNEEVARYNSNVSGLLDQRPDGNNANKAWAAPPWYQPPATLSKEQTSNKLAFLDQPGFELPIKNGGGVLSEIVGADNFVTSVGARRNGGAITHLSSQQWSVPWGMKIDPSTHLGDIGKQNETVFKNDNKIVPTVLDGPIATNVQDYYSFPTVDAARAAGVDALLSQRGLEGARGRDEQSYRNMWHAIRGLNPAWTVSIKCNEHGDLFYDSVNCQMKGNSGQKAQSFKMSKGDVVTGYVRFLELFDPDTWVSGQALRLVISAAQHNFKEISVVRPETAEFKALTPVGKASGSYEFSITRSDNG